MASTNLDFVRSVVAAWERGDYSAAEWAHPEIAFVIADGPTPGSWTGLAGMAEGWRSFLNAWEEFRGEEVDEYRELDGERVLMFHSWSGRGKTSGLELGQMRAKAATLFQVRGGKVSRLVIYFDRERALADLGLVPGGRLPALVVRFRAVGLRSLPLCAWNAGRLPSSGASRRRFWAPPPCAAIACHRDNGR